MLMQEEKRSHLGGANPQVGRKAVVSRLKQFVPGQNEEEKQPSVHKHKSGLSGLQLLTIDSNAWPQIITYVKYIISHM